MINNRLLLRGALHCLNCGGYNEELGQSSPIVKDSVTGLFVCVWCGLAVRVEKKPSDLQELVYKMVKDSHE
jgi:hypothetical protein